MNVYISPKLIYSNIGIVIVLLASVTFCIKFGLFYPDKYSQNCDLAPFAEMFIASYCLTTIDGNDDQFDKLFSMQNKIV